MNDVLAVFMICLALDFSEPYNSIFSELHAPKYFWSEAYFMYEAIMRMGVKGIYFREGPKLQASKKEGGTQTVKETSSSSIF